MRNFTNIWRSRFARLIAFGAVLLGILGVLANVLGILDYFGINPIQSGGQSIVETLTLTEVPAKSTQTANAPTPYPVSGLALIRSDDFSSQSSQWDNYTEPTSDTGYEAGKYYIELSTNALFLSTWKKAKDFENGVLSVDVLGPFGEGGAVKQGLGFGWHKDWQGSTYAFTIDYEGNCKFLEAQDGWIEKEIGKIDNFDSGKPFHTVMVIIRNGEAIGYVDNQFCAIYNMPNYTSGHVGVVASMWDGNGKAYFDEYRMYKLP
jgi:hypothetical protein